MQSKPRILFVDDEVAVLRSLKAMLRRERNRWDCVFASSGSEALEQLDAEPCLVVVSDMRMPAMSGEALLTEIHRRSPQTVSILLTGYADPEAVERLRSILFADLAKPCDFDILRKTIERALDSAVQT
ncbi:MAG TPA: response regulator [Kofleriaceae bacterium]|jgi:DNA-binding NtrC family response regulator